MIDERGHSRGFGFVNYENHEDARRVRKHIVPYVRVDMETEVFSLCGRQ